MKFCYNCESYEGIPGKDRGVCDYLTDLAQSEADGVEGITVTVRGSSEATMCRGFEGEEEDVDPHPFDCLAGVDYPASL